MRYLLTAMLVVAIAGGAAWYFNLWDPTKILIAPRSATPTTPGSQATEPDPDLGKPLYPVEPEQPASTPSRPLPKIDSLVMANFHLQPYQKIKVPSPRDGVLMFIGAEIDHSHPAKPGEYPTASILLGGKEIFSRNYKPWQENDLVQQGEMVALVNPAIAKKEHMIKLAQMAIAKEEYHASGKTAEEALAQYERAKKLPPTAIAVEELSIKKLVWEKQVYEERTKFEALKAAKEEADKAEIVVNQHFVYNDLKPTRTDLPGVKGVYVIKYLFKHDQESVKAYEDIMELHSVDLLRAEGSIGAEYASRVKEGMNVTVVPVHEAAPNREFAGHTREVTSVAVTKDADGGALIVSGSADHTVRVWQPKDHFPIRTWYHPREVAVVACSPKGEWCLSGCSDGMLRLWNLAKVHEPEAKEPLWTEAIPGGAGVTALAFSPHGNFFATGSDDNTIHLWEVVRSDHGVHAQRLYQLDSRHYDMHQGTITSLHFTRQCRLISAARDNTLRVWSLYEKGAKLHLPPIDNRAGTVSQLGVSEDGRWMLFDRGKELHVLSVADGNIQGRLKSSTAISFESLAVLSPGDASLLLTAGAQEGRLQLWKSPINGARPFELRQFVPKSGSLATCAAFSPDAGGAQSSFVATGSKDGYVYLWEVPSQAEVKAHPIRNLKVDMVDTSIESGAQVRVAVTVPNPVGPAPYQRGKLRPGNGVTIIVDGENDGAEN
jgi:WD40 repeat protein